jgi:molybdopterin synthase sulfur carrier subunit
VSEVAVDALTVRQAVAELDARFPGVRERLCEGGASPADWSLKPGLVAAVDGHVSSLGLMQKLGGASEVHFLPAVGGG